MECIGLKHHLTNNKHTHCPFWKRRICPLHGLLQVHWIWISGSLPNMGGYGYCDFVNISNLFCYVLSEYFTKAINYLCFKPMSFCAFYHLNKWLFCHSFFFFICLFFYLLCSQLLPLISIFPLDLIFSLKSKLSMRSYKKALRWNMTKLLWCKNDHNTVVHSNMFMIVLRKCSNARGSNFY